LQNKRIRSYFHTISHKNIDQYINTCNCGGKLDLMGGQWVPVIDARL